MRNSLVKLGRRFQSSTVTSNIASVSNSLDLDFVLSLLDHSSSSNTSTSNNNNNNSALGSLSSSNSWVPRLKFKVIEDQNTSESIKVKEESTHIEKRSDFSNLFNFSHVTELSEWNESAELNEFDSASSSMRLQSLADSLPTQIYDRHGNLIPLNTSQPPMNFFDMDSTASHTTAKTTGTTLPIFQRENVDWSKISLTSILKKIVPEEVFRAEHVKQDNVSEDTTTNEVKRVNTQSKSTPEFTQFELKLLDKDQLHALSKYLSIPCDQTDFKIESAILTHQKSNSKSKDRNNSMKGIFSKDKISWTEEHESLLMKLYEELRLEKGKVDQKLQSIISKDSHATPNAPSLKRGNGASDRGLWAVLGDRMSQVSKFHVSVTECRNKVIILKRLKA